jgi:hypothetical protein
VRLTLSALTFFGLTVALFQDLPAQTRTQASSSFEVVRTPNDNPNSELFAASTQPRRCNGMEQTGSLWQLPT